jgi:hypothetical protein
MFRQHPIILSKDITAVSILGTEDGTPPYGRIEKLARGTKLMVLGDGFNDRSVKVQCNGRLYFVFLQDIEGPDSSYYLS